MEGSPFLEGGRVFLGKPKTNLATNRHPHRLNELHAVLELAGGVGEDFVVDEALVVRVLLGSLCALLSFELIKPG